MNHILKRKFHKKGYINNFFTVGSPTFDGSVVSGFSTSNYLRLPDIVPLATADSWEKVVKFTYKTTGSNTQALITTSNDGGGSEETIGVSTKLFYRTSVTTGSELFKITGSTLLVDGNTYWGKIEFTGDTYNLYLSTTGKFNGEESLEGSYSSTIKCLSRKHYIGNTLISNYNYIATSFIDLKECYININGKRWWDGLKSCKYDYNFNVVGTPSISNPPSCIVSGFSKSNYLILDNSYKSTDNAEYVFKFRTGSSFSSHQVIAHAEYFLSLEINTSGNVWGYNWGAATENKLFTATTNTDYWVKILINGTTKTYSYSTDGINYTGDVTFTDTGFDVNNTTYQFRLGLYSHTQDRPFLGSIDLTQSYIKIKGELWWSCFKQTNYVVYKEDGTLEDYDFFDYKSYGLETTDYRKGYINNFFVVGAPNIANGSVVSGFSASAGCIIPESFAPVAGDTWEMNFKVHTGSNVSTEQQILGGVNADDDGIEFGIYSSKLVCWLGTGSYDLASEKKGTYTVLTNTDYWIRVTFDGENYTFYYSTDGNDYIQDIQVASTSVIKSGIKSIGFDKYAAGNPFLGSIDISQCYIKINNELWWTPYKRCKYDYNFTRVGTPSISNPPSCEVSGFSSANYLKTFEVPSDVSSFEFGAKFTTGATIKKQQGILANSSTNIYTPQLIIDSTGYLEGLTPTKVGTWGSGINSPYVLEANTTYWAKYGWDGDECYLDVSLDGEVYERVGTVTHSSIGWTEVLGIGIDQTNNPFLGSIDLTQSYIKINGKLWWACFKQSDHLSFDEKGTDEDYDFINTKRHFLRHPTKRYYKIVPWEQPILTSNTSYGALTGGGYYTSSDRNYWHISDGKIPTTNDGADSWGTNNTAVGWVNWALEEEILIKGIKIYNRSHTNAVDYTLTGARFYTNSLKTTPIGEEFEILTSQGIYELTTIPEEGIRTNNIYFYKTGSTYSGIGELEITADKIVQSTYKDWDFHKLEEEKNIVYNTKILKINPTPSYATVTINGEERNEIELMRNSSVSWSVSAEGYTSQSGTLMLSEDTTLDVELESLYVPWEQPLLTSDTSHGTLTTNGYRDFWKPWYAFDGIIGGSNKYLGPVTGGEIVWQTPEAIKVNSCKIYTTEESSQLNRFPQKITIYASDDNVNWIEIGSLTGYEQPASGESVTVSCNSTKPYAYTKWVFSQGFGNVYYGIAVSEIEIDAEFLEELSVPLYACYSDGETFIYVQTPLSTNSAFGWGIGYEQVSNSSEIEDVSSGPYDIVNVDDETLVYINTDFGIEISCTRYYEGDLYE